MTISSLKNQTIDQVKVRARYGVTILELERQEQVMLMEPQTELRQDDRIFVVDQRNG